MLIEATQFSCFCYFQNEKSIFHTILYICQTNKLLIHFTASKRKANNHSTKHDFSHANCAPSGRTFYKEKPEAYCLIELSSNAVCIVAASHMILSPIQRLVSHKKSEKKRWNFHYSIRNEIHRNNSRKRLGTELKTKNIIEFENENSDIDPCFLYRRIK